MLYPTTDDKTYNFQTYPGNKTYKSWFDLTLIFYLIIFFKAIDEISPKNGTEGTFITVTGKYLFNDKDIPALIDISGSPCKVISSNQVDLLNSKITCEILASNSDQVGLFGNRGITVYEEFVYTTKQNLGNTDPSENAAVTIYDRVQYKTSKRPVTVWMKGYLLSKKTSKFTLDLSVKGNIESIIYLSNDENPGTKIQIANDYQLTLEENKQ